MIQATACDVIAREGPVRRRALGDETVGTRPHLRLTFQTGLDHPDTAAKKVVHQDGPSVPTGKGLGLTRTNSRDENIDFGAQILGLA